MVLLLLLPLLAIAAGVAYAAGGRRTALAAGAAAAVVVVIVALLGGLVSDGGGDGRDEAPAVDAPQGATAAPAQPPGADAALRAPDVVLEPPEDPFDVPRAIDGLDDGDVRLVEVRHDRTVSLHQCDATDVSAAGCASGVVAVVDVDGAGDVEDRAPVLVQLTTTIRTGAGIVDCVATGCVLAALDRSEPLFEVPLSFGPAPPTRPVSVVPRRDVEEGDDVRVSVGGGEVRGTVAFCAADEDDTRPRCDGPGAARLGADGSATLRLGGCPRVERCAVRVAVDGDPVAYTQVAFASPPGPDLDSARVGGGLAAAGLLLAAAAVLLRRTDWSPPDGDPFAGIDLAGIDPFAGIDLADDDELSL